MIISAGAARDARNASEIPGFCVAVPKVRIRLPPSASLSQRGPADIAGQSRGFRAGPGLVWDVRKRRAGYDQTLFGPVSLTGFDAVPFRHSRDDVYGDSSHN